MSKNCLEELKIEVTYKCPLNCVHCSSNAGEGNQLTISKEKCVSIIKEAAEVGVKKIAFSGGEPLCWDGILEVVALCNQFGIESTIYTSGNCDKINEMFQDLSKAGLKRAIFSVYAPNKEEHIRITRKYDSFDKTVEAIAACRRNGITPELHFVALASNYKSLPDIVTFATENGIKRISVLRFVPQGRGSLIEQKDTLSQTQNKELIKTIRDLRASGYGIRTGSPFNVLWLNENPHCMAARDRMIVSPDLSIYPCDAFKQIKASELCDNVTACSLKNASLKECWENSTYFNLIRNAITTPAEEPCKSCAMYNRCHSGCLAQKYLKYKSLQSNRDPACLGIGASI